MCDVKRFKDLFWPEHPLLRVGPELVPLLPVGVPEPQGHVLLVAVDLGRLLERGHHGPLALAAVHLLYRVIIRYSF